MATETDHPSAEPARRRLAAAELSALLVALRRLYFQVSWRLTHYRLARPRRRDGVAVAPGIADPLMDHIDRAAGDPARPNGTESVPDAGAPAAAARSAAGALSPPAEGFFSRLAAYFRRKPGHVQDPHLAEQMRHSTNDHINRALILARQGNKEAARMHAQLAESAMRTAAAYMDDAEYEAFRQGVEERLRSIEGP